MQLPLGSWDFIKSKWKSILDPFLTRPTNNVSILQSVQLANGTTTINHNLGRTMQGWFIVDQTGAASIYRPATAPLNEQTLTLTSNAAVTVNIAAF